MAIQNDAKSRRLGLLLGALVAGAGVTLAWVYLNRFEAEVSGGERVAVLFAARDIAAGTPISDDVLSLRHIPSAYVDDRTVRAKDRDRIVGIEAVISVNAQQALQWTDLSVRTDIRNLSQLVPPGKRAVTIQASRQNQQQNLMIRPGDYVDVIASTTIMNQEGSRKERATTVLLQRVLVVAVGLSTDRNAEEPTGKRPAREDKVLTLSLDIDEAQLLALAVEQGTVSVAVRNPDDQKIREDLPDMQASSLIEARDRVRARKQSLRSGVQAPVRITEAR